MGALVVLFFCVFKHHIFILFFMFFHLRLCSIIFYSFRNDLFLLFYYFTIFLMLLYVFTTAVIFSIVFIFRIKSYELWSGFKLLPKTLMFVCIIVQIIYNLFHRIHKCFSIDLMLKCTA